MKNLTDIKTVLIPACGNHYGFYLSKIHLFWRCPRCGEQRGEVFKTLSYDGSRRLECDGWRNPCGHVDYYDDVIKEAAYNGLNGWINE